MSYSDGSASNLDHGTGAQRHPDAPLKVAEVTPFAYELGELNAERQRLTAAAGALTIGVAISTVKAGARLTPAHAHADEEEVFYVLEGDGISYQLPQNGKNPRAHAIKQGDCLVHPAGGDAHTIIAGPNGIKVLILAEGSRTGITYLPRSKQNWLGQRWLPIEGPMPFVGDMNAGPLELPELTERPKSILNESDCAAQIRDQGRFKSTVRWVAAAAGATRTGMTLINIEPGALSAPRHWHLRSEELFLVTAGSGTLRVGEESFALAEGEFFFRPAATGKAHQIQADAEGISLVGMSNRPIGDIVVYPDSQKASIGLPGQTNTWVKLEQLSYWDGEPDATA